MDIKYLLNQYVQAHQLQAQKEDALAKAFYGLGQDNTIISLITDEFTYATDDILKALIGDYNYDWLMWYMYDVTIPTKVIIDDKTHLIASVDDLVDHCFIPTTTQKQTTQN